MTCRTEPAPPRSTAADVRSRWPVHWSSCCWRGSTRRLLLASYAIIEFTLSADSTQLEVTLKMIPALSRLPLRVLREARLVESRVDIQRRMYRLCPDSLRELDAWLEPYRLLWSGRLDDLEHHLNEMEDE